MPRKCSSYERYVTDTKTGTHSAIAVLGITSRDATRADAPQIATYPRAHWSIENKLHYVRNVTYSEDASPTRTHNGPRVMASFRNLAISTLRLAGKTTIATALRHNARDFTRPSNSSESAHDQHQRLCRSRGWTGVVPDHPFV